MPTRLGPSAEETKEYLKLLTPLFTKAGLDFDKFNKNQDRTSRLTAKPDSELTKEYHWRKKSLQKNAESISAIQPLLLSTVNHQLLNIQPLFILANPASALQNSNIGLNDNWAKFYWDYKLDAMVPDSVGAFLSFFYVWENLSESPALVDADTYVGLFGKCTAHADGGFFTNDGWCLTSLEAAMAAYVSWEKPPLPPAFGSNTVDVLDLSAMRDWPLPGNAISQQVLDFPHLTINGMLVPAGESVLFEVAASYRGSQFNGEMTCDFNSGDWNISNNSLTLNVWYLEVSINS